MTQGPGVLSEVYCVQKALFSEAAHLITEQHQLIGSLFSHKTEQKCYLLVTIHKLVLWCLVQVYFVFCLVAFKEFEVKSPSSLLVSFSCRVNPHSSFSGLLCFLKFPAFWLLFEYDNTSPVTITLRNLNEFKTRLSVLSALPTIPSF